MTENRKIHVGSVKGDTLVTKLQRPLLSFEWTECQLQSPSVVTLKNINSHSLHNTQKAFDIWQKLKCVGVHRMNTYIYSFHAFNDVRCFYTYV